MSTVTSQLPETLVERPHSSLNSDSGRLYALAALGFLALLPAALSAFNVLHNPAHTDLSIYGFASLSFLAAAASQSVLVPPQGNGILRVRWHLWTAFLLLNAIGLLLAFLHGRGLVDFSERIKYLCFSIAYAIAYVITVNPPRSSAWRRLWLVDAMLACVMGVIFFMVYRSGMATGIYTSLLFAVAMQIIFSLGSLLSLRTAETSEAQDLARYMLAYFILSTIVRTMLNLPRIWPRASLLVTADLVCPAAAVGLALVPLILHIPFLRRFMAVPQRTRRLPPAAPVLVTCAILLVCLPLLHLNVITGIALLVVAVTLFALKVALMQTDFEHERTSLLQSNKQLRELAYIDPVTGIANRRKFMEIADDALRMARRGLEPHWLILIELEDLRSVTASGGRRSGELYLCDFVRHVSSTLDTSTTLLAHLASGEFALLMKRANQQTTELAVQRIRDVLQASNVRVATGAALATSSGPDTVERWLANAGTILHRSRGFHHHTPADF
jgi:diguanylate cyclase (GGDEF)-like protein